MSYQDVVAMLLRHRLVIAIIALAAGLLSYQLIRENPGYTDSASVTFIAPKGSASSFQNTRSRQIVEEVTAWYMMGPQGEQQVRAAGGTEPYNVAMLNLYNDEFPDYSKPYINITVMSRYPMAAQRTFRAVLGVLRTATATLQEQVGATPKDEVRAALAAGPSGPVPQGGSHKRSYAALAVLMAVAICIVAGALDRRRRRRGGGSGRHRHAV